MADSGEDKMVQGDVKIICGSDGATVYLLGAEGATNRYSGGWHLAGGLGPPSYALAQASPREGRI